MAAPSDAVTALSAFQCEWVRVAYVHCTQIFGLGTNHLHLTKQPVVSGFLLKMVVDIYPFEETKLVDYPLRKML